MCVYVTNGQVHTSLDNLHDAIFTNIDDLEIFLNNTVSVSHYQ